MQKCHFAPTCHSRLLLSFPRRRESRGINPGRNPRSGRTHATKTGVTLLEMIVVMAIIIIITAASLPSFLKFINTSRLRGSARDITTALRTARRYAITQRKDYSVVVCMNDLDIINPPYTPPVSVTLMKNAVTFYDTADTVELKRFPTTVQGDEGYTNGLKEFTFSSRGTTSSDTIRVVDPNGRYIDITVVGATGRVKIGEIE